MTKTSSSDSDSDSYNGQVSLQQKLVEESKNIFNNKISDMKNNKRSANFAKLQLKKVSADSTSDESSEEENSVAKPKKKVNLSKRKILNELRKAKEKLKMQYANTDDSESSLEDEPKIPISNQSKQMDKCKVTKDSKTSNMNSKLIKAASLSTRKDFLQKMITSSNDVIDNIVQNKGMVIPKSILKTAKSSKVNAGSDETDVERKLLPLSQGNILNRRKSLGKDTSFMDTSFANVLSSTQIPKSQDTSSSSEDGSKSNNIESKSSLNKLKVSSDSGNNSKFDSAEDGNEMKLQQNQNSLSNKRTAKSPLKKNKPIKENHNKNSNDSLSDSTNKVSNKGKQTKMKISPIKSVNTKKNSSSNTNVNAVKEPIPFKKIDFSQLLNNKKLNKVKSSESESETEPAIFTSTQKPANDSDSDGSNEISCAQRTPSQIETLKRDNLTSKLNVRADNGETSSDSDISTNYKKYVYGTKPLSVETLKSIMQEKHIPPPTSSSGSDSDDFDKKSTPTSTNNAFSESNKGGMTALHKTNMSKSRQINDINNDSSSNSSDSERTKTESNFKSPPNKSKSSSAVFEKEKTMVSSDNKKRKDAASSSDSDSELEKNVAASISHSGLNRNKLSQINIIKDANYSSDSDDKSVQNTTKDYPSNSDSDSDRFETNASVVNQSKSPQKNISAQDSSSSLDPDSESKNNVSAINRSSGLNRNESPQKNTNEDSNSDDESETKNTVEIKIKNSISAQSEQSEQNKSVLNKLKSPQKNIITQDSDSSSDSEKNIGLKNKTSEIKINNSNSAQSEQSEKNISVLNKSKSPQKNIAQDSASSSASDSELEMRKKLLQKNTNKDQISEKNIVLKNKTAEIKINNSNSAQKNINAKDSSNCSDSEQSENNASVLNRSKSAQKNMNSQGSDSSSDSDSDDVNVGKTVNNKNSEKKAPDNIELKQSNNSDSSSETENLNVNQNALKKVYSSDNTSTFAPRKMKNNISKSISIDSEKSKTSNIMKQKKRESISDSASTSASEIDEPTSKKHKLADLDVIQPKHIEGAMYNSMKEFLIANPSLEEMDTETKFNFSDLDENDEVWLVQVPKTLDPNLLTGQKLNFGQGKLKLKLGGTKYEYDSRQSKSNICLCASQSSRNKKLIAKSIQTNGTIVVHEVLKETLSEIQVTKKTKVQQPADLKLRHPIFGPNFQDKIELNDSITNKLIEAELLKRKADNKIQNKRKRKSTENKNKTDDSFDKNEMIFQLLRQSINEIDADNQNNLSPKLKKMKTKEVKSDSNANIKTPKKEEEHRSKCFNYRAGI